MNNKQYNNIIEHTLINEQSAQTGDSLATARAIFDNMGVALPQGDMKTVYETIKTNDYMGWKSCTKEEAQVAADKGIAAIGISEDKIIVVSANDEEQPIAQTASVMTLNETVSPLAVDGIEYYAYNGGTTCSGGGTNENTSCNTEPVVLDKPYDENYPYETNFANSEAYYSCLSTYSHELRSDMVFEFDFEGLNRLRAHLSLLYYARYTEQEAKKVLLDTINVGLNIASYTPTVGVIFSIIDTVRVLNSLGIDSVQENIRDIKECIDAFAYHLAANNKVYKNYSNITYKVSLLMKNPIAGREIKIETSTRKKDIYIHCKLLRMKLFFCLHIYMLTI